MHESINTLLSKSSLKQFQQLGSKKFRQKYGLFVVEGLKSIQELLRSNWEVETILCRSDFNSQVVDLQKHTINVIDHQSFSKISSLQNPQGVLAIVHCRKGVKATASWEIALDKISDPGNLGTILRIADWYGVKNLICNNGTVDLFNPKVIQASMGSFVRVELIETNLEEYLMNKNVFAAVLNGQNIRSLAPQKSGIILIGNEAHGISSELLSQVKHEPITIPGGSETESLNAAIATAICCERLIQL